MNTYEMIYTMFKKVATASQLEAYEKLRKKSHHSAASTYALTAIYHHMMYNKGEETTEPSRPI